jgi:hypothetical protein
LAITAVTRCLFPALLASVALATSACSGEVGRLELWNRLEDPIVVFAGDRQYAVEGCGELKLDGADLSGIRLARADGSVYAVFDVGGVAEPLMGARYIVEQSQADALDLRVPPASLPPCRGRIPGPLY